MCFEMLPTMDAFRTLDWKGIETKIEMLGLNKKPPSISAQRFDSNTPIHLGLFFPLSLQTQS